MVPITEKEIEILNFIGASDNLSQRKISNSLGLSLGLVNLFLKKLVNKGFIKIKKTGSAKSLQYILTSKGFNERLNFNLYYLKKNLHYYSGAKQALLQKLEQLSEKSIINIYIFGTDDWAEIIYLALQNFDFNLMGFIDDNGVKNKFNKPVYNLSQIENFDAARTSILANLEQKALLLEKYNGLTENFKFEFF